MADKRIDQLDAANALVGNEPIPVYQGATTKRSTPDAIRDRAIGSLGSLTEGAALDGTEHLGMTQAGSPRRTTPDAIRDRSVASLGSLTAGSALDGTEHIGMAQSGAARRTTPDAIRNRTFAGAGGLTAASALDGTEILGLAQGGNPRRATVDEINRRDVVTIGVACSDETTDITAGAAKVTFRMPYAMTLTAVRASLTTAQATGSIFTVDINENGTSVLSTKLTIDNTERTSTTAATPAVISDSALADDAEITIDVDQIGTTGARGLKVWLIGRRA